MTLHRRSNNISGYVNFPVESTEFISSCEGGLFVELWVIPETNKEWMMCCGGYGISTQYCESLVGTDKTRNSDNSREMNKDPTIGQKFKLEEELFPYIRDNNNTDQYNSISLYACVLLGSTGWSGRNNRRGMWRCTFDDLNDEGKQLYKMLERLYGVHAKLSLVTWLDT
jgi:hypothetical protein